MDRSQYRQQCVYIPQDFILIEHLTVLETMDYAAELKMPSASRSMMVRKKKVNDILQVLGLDGSMHTLVKNLSGGEKKRLSIGIEMVCNPPIILLDEPTSGLDSVSAMQLMSYAKTLAMEGRTVVCVIHQPSSSLFNLFDELYLLSAGMCIYHGPVDEMVGVFAETGFHCPKFYNRADFALEVASKSPKEVEYLMLKYSKQPVTARKLSRQDNSSDDRSSGEVCEFFAQLRVIAHILVGFLLGIVFYRCGEDASHVMTNGASLFFFQLFIFFGNAMPCVITCKSCHVLGSIVWLASLAYFKQSHLLSSAVPLEARVFIRERLNNWYSLEAYYVSKIFADLPLQMICPTLFIVIAYFMTGQPLEWERFGMLWLINLLLGMYAQTVGLLSGAAFDIQMATFFVPCFSIPSMLFSGFFVKSFEMPEFLQPAVYTSFFRYSFQGSLQAIYSYNRTNLPCSDIVCYFNKPAKFLKFMDTPEEGYWNNVSIVAGFIVLFQIVLYIVLRHRLKIYQ
ncbi:abc transporter [Anopheles darlingi]|uniref:Abc transporter n=1 Tax=Anopheles darlingi TaxID=43151 RepID=W5J6R6_ANODA|nr:abc transporter [Anopheles darlingi]